MQPGNPESLRWRGAAISSVTVWPCLDLVNTVEWRLSDRNDFLADYDDLVHWGRHSGLFGDEEARRLLTAAALRPTAAAAAYRRAIALRQTLSDVLSPAARVEAPPATALDSLNAALAEATVPMRLIAVDSGFRREWLDPNADPGWFLNRVVRSAADLLISPDAARLKECPGGPGKACGFLFLDETKNRNRRWCSGRTCGNRTRLHRYYARAQSSP